MKNYLLFIITVLLAITSKEVTAQNFSSEEQQQLDSLNAIINNKASHDTSLVGAYVGLSNILYVSNLDTVIPLCTKAQEIAGKALSFKPTKIVALSLQKSLAEALNNIGVIHYNQGDIPLALDYWHKSLKIQEEIGNNIGIADSYNNIGYIHKQQGDIPLALEYWHKSLKIYEEIGNKSGMAISYNNIGVIHKNQGDIPLALEYYHKSLKIREEIGDKSGIANSYNNIGLIHYNQGDIPLALEYYHKSLKIQEEIGNKRGMAESYNNIGVIHQQQGDIPLALEYYHKSLNIEEEIGNKSGMATSYNNIGAIHNNQGDIPLALEYFHKSLKIYEEIGNKSGMAQSYINIGAIHNNQGDPSITSSKEESLRAGQALALDYLHKSLKIREEIGDKSGLATTLSLLGGLHLESGAIAQAREMGERGYQLSKELGFADQTQRNAELLAKVYIKEGNYKEAFEKLNQAYNLSVEIGKDEGIKNSSRALYQTYLLTDSIHNAYKFLSILIERRNQNLKTNFFTLPEKEKQIYFATMEEDYSLYHDFALNFQSRFENLTDTSFNIALQNKGLTLKSSTAMRSAIQNSGDTILIKEYENWLTLKKKIAKSNETVAQYKDWVNQANEIERALVKSSTIFSDFDKLKNLKWQDVQAGLKPNEAAIEFIHFKSVIDTTHPIIYAALIVKKDSKHPEMIRLCTEADLKEILGVFQGNNLSFVKGVYGTKSKAEKALYEKIWEPLEKHLQGVQNIYYSPSGLLHKVSFAAICKDNNVFLCDNYQLHQQSSTGKVALPSNVMYDAKDAYLLMGGVQYNTDKTKKEVWSYLPGTLNETDNIQSFLEKKKHSVNLFAANDANETNFKTQAQKANVLHISTHGFFFPDPEQVREEAKKDEVNEENIIFRGTEALDSAERSSSLYANWSFVINKNPLMRSGLVLAGANDVWQRNALEEGEDGILTAQEVSNLDLRNTKLVVLSACETGLGDIKGSEGVFGLQRAFKMAGAEYLIMSLWQVPDKETAEFMELFYKNLVKLKDIPKAFNITQQVMRKKYDPYYWAAFVLIN
jgi:CHAT domain-containing protein